MREIAQRWPAAVAPDGTLDRAALAAIVFGDDRARARLNAIVHPRVRALAAAREELAPPDAPVVHVIPLLFEGDAWKSFDATVVVVAPDELRIERAMRRDGVERGDVERRMRAQIDPLVARARATYVIENDGDFDALRARALTVYDDLRLG